MLANIGLSVEIVPSKFPEDLDKTLFSPAEYVVENARQKGVEVSRRLLDDKTSPEIIISADTVVVLDAVILEKPRSEEEAKSVLKLLSGRKHEVITGVSITFADRPPVEFFETTEVEFATLSEKEIASYVATREPMDKAGSYGIQGVGGVFVTGIKGDYYNVVGFPLHRFAVEIAKAFSQ